MMFLDLVGFNVLKKRRWMIVVASVDLTDF